MPTNEREPAAPLNALGKYPVAISIAAIAADVALFVLQLWLTHLEAKSQRGIVLTPGGLLDGAVLAGLAFPVAYANPSIALFAGLVGDAIAQAGVLWILWRALGFGLNARSVRFAAGAAAAVMLALGVWDRSLLSFDVYIYVEFAKLGLAAYHPPHVAFAGEYSIINRMWGVPMIPCLYGPLWLAVERAAAGGAATLSAGIVLTKLVGAAAVTAMALAAGRAGVGRVGSALIVLNPAVVTYYVANAHNDALGITFLLLAIAAAATPLRAVLLVVCAGLVKLPMVLCALLVFRGPGSVGIRCAYVGLSVVLAVAGSYLFGGPAYLGELSHRGLKVAFAPVRVIDVMTVFALLLIFFRGIVRRSGSWTLGMFGNVSYPWYLIWGLPYAALERRALAQFLIGFPLIAALLEPIHSGYAVGDLTLAAIFGYVVWDFSELLWTKPATGPQPRG
jgi:hypothetical protein